MTREIQKSRRVVSRVFPKLRALDVWFVLNLTKAKCIGG
jgi:hypothetical protein